MTGSLFARGIVPVASKDDDESTTAALAPYVESAGGTVVAVHVIDKAGGPPDKASVEQRQLEADEIFDVVEAGLADVDVELETEYLYGTDVAEAIIDAAHDHDATAIVFTPRGGSRWIKLLAGDVATELITDSDLPVVVLPDEPRGESER